MYEIWGYIKVIEALNKIDFIPVKGWIYDDVNLDFQGLNSGTCVEMKSGSSYKHIMNLKIIYDDVIKPDESARVTPSHPLWHSSSHNRPDIRIEVYDENMIFQNAIILDTKYRRLKDIYNHGKGGVLDQLNAYRYQIRSPYPFIANNYKKYEPFRLGESDSVIDVAALYPGEINNRKESLDELKVGSAKSVVLNPKFPNNNSLISFLKNSFNQQEQIFEKFEELDQFIK